MVYGYVEALGILHHPLHVLVDVCGVDDDEELVVTHLVYQQVVHGAAVGVEHHAVVDLVQGCAGDIVGEDVVYISLGIGPAHPHLAHVADVEHSAVLSYGLMLVDDV